MWKQVGIEVTDATGKIGNLWDQGTTTVTLRPAVQPPLKGVWYSTPADDIFASGCVGVGTEPPAIQRFYDFSTTQNLLFLRVNSTNLEDVMKKRSKKVEIECVPITTVLSFKDFNIHTPLGSSGTGNFFLARKTFTVNWDVFAELDVKDLKADAAPPKARTALGMPFRLEPNDPKLIKRTTQGFQEYEYFSDRQECLYVGRSGGKDGKDPSTWVDRLTKEHIATEWILEAKTVVVLYGMTLAESMAQEEYRIRGGNGRVNKQQGDFSGSRMDESSLAANAQAAERHAFKETFRIVVGPD